MNAEQMWQAYGQNGEYEAWCFGDDADTLAQLVLNGIKTATASAYAIYEKENEEIPRAGQYSVILDSRENAVCIIRTDSVEIRPFSQIDEAFAFQEGEGDRTLAYWRHVHKTFFTGEMEAAGLSFSEDMLVVMERFTRVYPV